MFVILFSFNLLGGIEQSRKELLHRITNNRCSIILVVKCESSDRLCGFYT